MGRYGRSLGLNASGYLDLHRAVLELGDLAVGVEGFVGQQVGRRLLVAERNKNLFPSPRIDPLDSDSRKTLNTRQGQSPL